MTMMVRDCPEEAVTAIKWRTSRHGGRTWAQPVMCSEQLKGLLQVARATAHGDQDTENKKVRSMILGSLGKRPSELMQKVLHEISEVHS